MSDPIFLPLGTPVTFKRGDRLIRREVHEQAGFPGFNGPTTVTTRLVKRWLRTRDATKFRTNLDEDVRGIIVGVRTLQIGFTYGGWDEPPTWIKTETLRAYQVGVNLHVNPYMLMLDDVVPEVARG